MSSYFFFQVDCWDLSRRHQRARKKVIRCFQSVWDSSRRARMIEMKPGRSRISRMFEMLIGRVWMWMIVYKRMSRMKLGRRFNSQSALSQRLGGLSSPSPIKAEPQGWSSDGV